MYFIAIATGVLLIITGLINLIVGFLALFPGLFEVGVSEAQLGESQPTSFIVLASTSYGLYAVCHLIGSAIQIIGGSYFSLVLAKNYPLIHALIAISAITLGLEIWSWYFKGYLTVFAIPGVMSGALCIHMYWATVSRHQEVDPLR